MSRSLTVGTESITSTVCFGYMPMFCGHSRQNGKTESLVTVTAILMSFCLDTQIRQLHRARDMNTTILILKKCKSSDILFPFCPRVINAYSSV